MRTTQLVRSLAQCALASVLALATWALYGRVSLTALDGVLGALPPRAPPGATAPPSFDAPARVLPATSQRYVIEASLDPERHEIRGRVRLSVQNTSQRPLEHFALHLYMNAFEHERTVFRREDKPGFRGDAHAGTGSVTIEGLRSARDGSLVLPRHTEGDPDDRTDLRIALPSPVPVGELLELEIDFLTKLPPVTLRTGYHGSFHMGAQWFPKLAKLEPDGSFVSFPYQRLSEFYADFADYDVTLEAPSSFVVGATGALVSREDGGATTRHRYAQRAVIDFAFAAWDRFEEREEHAAGVQIRCLFPPGHDALAERQLEAAKRGLAFFGEWLGPYPYATLTIISPPAGAREAGGMEYPTLITTGGPFWAGLVPALATEHLVLHELAHQWFFAVIATNEHRFPFLDEGLTTYATGEAVQALYGTTLSPLVELSIAGVDRATRPRPSGPAIASPAGAFESGYDYGASVYARAATALRTLDGVHDRAAWRSLARYARAQRFMHPVPADLYAAVRDEAGSEAAALLEAMVSEPLSLDLVALAPVDAEGGTLIRIERRGSLSVPVEVLVLGAGGQRELLRFGPAETELGSALAHVTGIQVDPEHRVLIDERLANNAWSASPGAVPLRTLALTGALAGVALALGGP